MADKKISALTAASTPLAGTEVLPIVQSGATVKVAVSDLTAGRAISATQISLTAGNVIPANGYGIDFSATPGTGTSELLNDYETGTWTPVCARQTGGAITAVYEIQTGKYTKVGNLVTISGLIVITSVSSQGSGENRLTGLPFTPADNSLGAGAVSRNTAFTTSVIINCLSWSDAQMRFTDNTNSSTPVSVDWKSGIINFSFSYFV